MDTSIPPGEEVAGPQSERSLRHDAPQQIPLPIFPDNAVADPGEPANDRVPTRRRWVQQALPWCCWEHPPPRSPSHRTVLRPRHNRRD